MSILTRSALVSAASLACAMTLGVGASHADITYHVNRDVGVGSVVGSITTDGNTGVLGVGDIVSWDLLLTGAGGVTFDLKSPNNAYVSGSDLTATSHLLLFNFAGADGGRFLLQQGPENGQTYYCVSTANNDCFRGESDVPVSIGDPSFQHANPEGIQVLGVAAVPEPATWAMMLLGVGLIGAALRGFHRLNRELDRLAA